MVDLTVRVYPGDQKLIATTIYAGEDFTGQGCTVGDALIDLGNTIKGFAHEVRSHRQYDPIPNRRNSVSKNSDW